LVGFGWIRLDLVGFGWIWLDLVGFGWVWLDSAWLGWARLGLVWLDLVVLGWAGLGWAGLGWAGLGLAGLGWAGIGWTGLVPGSLILWSSSGSVNSVVVLRTVLLSSVAFRMQTNNFFFLRGYIYRTSVFENITGYQEIQIMSKLAIIRRFKVIFPSYFYFYFI
jgi:hypothetical protein